MGSMLGAILLALNVPSDVPTFTERGAEAGLSFIHATTVAEVAQGEPHAMTPGIAVADVDLDGDLDVFVAGGTGQNARLFVNDGSGSFSDEALARGIDLTGAEGACASFADVDGDGWPDLYAGTLAPRNFLYLNKRGSFVEVGVASGAVLVGGDPFDSFGATFGDVEGDADLDLVVTDWTVTSGIVRNRLFVNAGDGTFTDATVLRGAFSPPLVRGFAALLVDLSGDRAPELAVAGDFSTSAYHANDGDGAFTRLFDNGTGTDENGMGCAFGDYDGDGDLDWFVTSIFDADGVSEGNWGVTGNRLYRNEGGHEYTDVTDAAGVRDGQWGWGASFADLDLDGRLDLVMTNGFANAEGECLDCDFLDDPSRVWMNTGDFVGGPTYVEVAQLAGVDHVGSGKGLVTFDADLDGDVEILIATNHGPLAYYRSDVDPPANRWIEIDLAAPPGCAPDGVGATIDVTAAGMTQHRAVFGNPSFMSQEPWRVHVGFPATETIDRIAVRWPDGRTTVRTDVAPGRLVRIGTADLDRSGDVGWRDLLVVLSSWGPCPDDARACAADLDLDGAVGTGDVVIVFAEWE
jgi:hypothetical protein